MWTSFARSFFAELAAWKLMLTFTPTEVERIAGIARLSSGSVQHVLAYAGGECVKAEASEALRATVPDVTPAIEKGMAVHDRAKVELEIIMLLHASRDAQRNRGADTTTVRLDPQDAYYGEAFGIVRSLQLLGYGYFGSVNTEEPDRWNLASWFYRLEGVALDEEHFGGTNECDWCFEQYGKDAARRQFPQ